MNTGVGEESRTTLEEPLEKPIVLPRHMLSSLKRELNLTDEQVTGYVIALVEKSLSDHIADANAKIFSASETEEIENDLKGLGYI